MWFGLSTEVCAAISTPAFLILPLSPTASCLAVSVDPQKAPKTAVSQLAGYRSVKGPHLAQHAGPHYSLNAALCMWLDRLVSFVTNEELYAELDVCEVVLVRLNTSE